MSVKKKKFLFSLFFFFNLLTVLMNAQDQKGDVYFTPPLKIPLFISGNFAELRPDHFHSGIDIKTGGKIGAKVYSVEDGYVSRVKITENGYGKSLYITHNNGYVSVYGHLNNFNDTLNNYVKKNQYANKAFIVDLFPRKGEFTVKKGELIGYSGNTGGSNGPHLHFEIRDAFQNPVNPLLFNFNIKDNIPPSILHIIIYPKDTASLINNENKKVIYKVEYKNGNYSIYGSPGIELWGKFAFGIEAYDYLNGSKNRCGIYITELYVDSMLCYRSRMDYFSFDDTRYINSLLDYEEAMKSKKDIQRAFIEPNNQLKIYDRLQNSGIVDFSDNEKHEVQFILKDTYQNTSKIHFPIISTLQIKKDTLRRINNNYTGLFPYNKENVFERQDIKINFPAYSFYDTLYFKYEMTEPLKNGFSYVHHLQDIYTPVHKYFTLSLKTYNLPEPLTEKALIVKINKKNELEPIGGKYKEDFITAKSNAFGKYTVVVDTFPPSILPINLHNGNNNLTNAPGLRFKIRDDISGIKFYNGYIDNEWALFEYDLKNDLLFYTFDEERLVKKDIHEVELYVTDNKNNIAVFHAKFFRE